ncbi:C4-dicarboxylate ABC transporter [Marinobacterium aestuarii]|uniref:TRAP transporter small permease protein n=1 Tax=Marinobacterium aestuarii TaxID=1821621 RepID=A0A1A9EX06_9GAMM|nr:TRAP transporter small permease subunit [Marinobacterium aestuarii]ANG62198.1 C4-dicarboxylate ABC transporter [Marinobacterium aestuarii]
MLMLKLERAVNRVSDLFGKAAAVLFVLLLFNVFYDVVSRYAFNDVSIAMQEMEWHLFALMFLLGVPFTLRADAHVRVDIIYDRLSLRKRAWIDLTGTLCLLLPFCLLVGWYGVGFAHESFLLGESSGDPGGLGYRWLIKAAIPFAFFATALSGFGLALKSVNTLRGQSVTDLQGDRA